MPSVGEDVKQLDSHLLVELRIGIIALENCPALSTEVKHMTSNSSPL